MFPFIRGGVYEDASGLRAFLVLCHHRFRLIWYWAPPVPSVSATLVSRHFLNHATGCRLRLVLSGTGKGVGNERYLRELLGKGGQFGKRSVKIQDRHSL